MIDKKILKILKKELDIYEDDELYVIKVGKRFNENGEEYINVQRFNRGMNAFELIGILQNTILDLNKQINKEMENPIILDKKYLSKGKLK